jgi:hypothetical protein
MSLPRRLVVGLMLSALFGAPLAADVVPSSYPESSSAKAGVQNRLNELGVGADAARERVARLSPEQAAYLAADPARVQVVGQEMFAGQSNNLWWEWVGGIAALVGAGILVYVFAFEND